MNHPWRLVPPPGRGNSSTHFIVQSGKDFGRGDSREKEALEAFQRAEECCSGIKELHNNLGGTLADAGKNELAIAFFKNALAVDPDYALAIKNLANVFFSLERYTQGLHWFRRTLDLDPQNEVALLGRARALKKRDRSTAYLSYTILFAMRPTDALRKEIEAFVEAAFGKESLELAAFVDQAERVSRRRDRVGAMPSSGFPETVPPPSDSLVPDAIKRHMPHSGPHLPASPAAPGVPGLERP